MSKHFFQKKKEVHKKSGKLLFHDWYQVNLKSPSYNLSSGISNVFSPLVVPRSCHGPWTRIVVESLQISTPSKINRQLRKLKSPYFWPQKFVFNDALQGTENLCDLKSLSFHFNCNYKGLENQTLPESKTARTSCPCNKEGTAPRRSTFKINGRIAKFISCFRQQYIPVHHFTLLLHRKLTEL